MQRRRRKTDQRHPLALNFGHVPQRLSRQLGAPQIMLVLQPIIELAAFLLT